MSFSFSFSIEKKIEVLKFNCKTITTPHQQRQECRLNPQLLLPILLFNFRDFKKFLQSLPQQ